MTKQEYTHDFDGYKLYVGDKVIFLYKYGYDNKLSCLVKGEVLKITPSGMVRIKGEGNREKEYNGQEFLKTTQFVIKREGRR